MEKESISIFVNSKTSKGMGWKHRLRKVSDTFCMSGLIMAVKLAFLVNSFDCLKCVVKLKWGKSGIVLKDKNTILPIYNTVWPRQGHNFWLNLPNSLWCTFIRFSLKIFHIEAIVTSDVTEHCRCNILLTDQLSILWFWVFAALYVCENW